MALNFTRKKAIVAEVNEVAKQAVSCVVAEYNGLNALQITELRSLARNSDVHLQVVRNTLAKRAFVETDFACTNDLLVGPVILAFAKNEPGSAARMIRDFAKANNALQVKGLALSGKLLASSQLNAVANLPNKEQALARLAGTIQAPITKLVRVLAAPQLKLVRTLVAIKQKKEQEAA